MMTEKELAGHLRHARTIQNLVFGISIINILVILFFSLSVMRGGAIL